MEDLFQQAKRAAGTAMERAAWEADKVRRAAAKQKELDLLQRERTTLSEQLVNLVLDLERQGKLPEGPITPVAQRLRAIADEVSAGQAEVQHIREEPFVPGSITVSVQRKGGTSGVPEATAPCPTCGRPVRTSASYCPACGARLR